MKRDIAIILAAATAGATAGMATTLAIIKAARLFKVVAPSGTSPMSAFRGDCPHVKTL